MANNPFEGYDEKSKKEFQGTKFLTFDEVQNGVSTLQDFYKKKNIAIDYSKPRKLPPMAYSPLSKNGDDVTEFFFRGSYLDSYGGFHAITDPNVGEDPHDHIQVFKEYFWYDTNNSRTFGDTVNGIADELVFKVKLFITRYYKELDDVYNNPTIIPDDNEILLFLEVNEDDWSGATLRVKKGKRLQNSNFLNNVAAENPNFTEYIQKKYPIDLGDLQELLREGEVTNYKLEAISMLFLVTSYLNPSAGLVAGIAELIKKGITLIRENCTIDEKHWNPTKAAKGKKFEPFLFPGVATTDNPFKQEANEFIKEGIHNLRAEIKQYDENIRSFFNSPAVKVSAMAVFPTITATATLAGKAIPESFFDLLIARYNNLRDSLYEQLDALEKLDFWNEGIDVTNAFLCGIWNGFVEAVCGLLSLVQYLFEGAALLEDLQKNFKEKGPQVIERMDDIIKLYKKVDFSKVYTKLVADIKQWVQNDPNISLVEGAYFCGLFIGIVIELAIEIAVGILFTGGVLSVEAVLAKLGEAFKAIAGIVTGTVKGLYKAGQKTLTGFIEGLNFLIEFLAKGTDEIIRLIDDIFAKLKQVAQDSSFIKQIDESLFKFIELLSLNTSYVKCINLVKESRNLGKWLAIESEAMIKLYTANTYIRLNKSLRGIGSVSLNKELKAMQKVLDDALEKLPISQYNKQVLQRSAYFTEAEIEKLFKVGDDFIDKGFMSTTHSEKALMQWLKDNPSHNVIFKVYGKNGKLIEAASMLPLENEVLFKSGTGFVVESINKGFRNPIDRNKKIIEIILKEK
jgi:hypothetical protein